jgi:hypothetical protein
MKVMKSLHNEACLPIVLAPTNDIGFHNGGL